MGGFQHILVPLDGTPNSELALPTAMKALAEGGKLSVLRIADLVADHYLPDGSNKRAIWDKQLGPVQEYLDSISARLEKQNLVFETEIATGSPADVILEWANQGEIDAVAMCTHTESKLRQFFLGSVFQAILERCPVPVIVVHPPAKK